MLVLLFALACSDPPPPTREDWARMALEDPDPSHRSFAIGELQALKDPDLPGIILESLKRHDRSVDPRRSHGIGNKLLGVCMKHPNHCIPCEPCPETAHPACREVDWDRKGCFAGEGDDCPVPQLIRYTNYTPCDELHRDTDEFRP